MQTTSTDSIKSSQLLFFFILGAAALLRLYMITLDMNLLLDQGLVQDDAFYYYVIARHLIEHGQSSFDGINLTNGYHPLWQAISIPVFYFTHGNIAVRLMLGIASILDLVSLVIFYKILQRTIKNNYVVLTGVAILAFHGTIIRTWFNGLETALSLFSLLWLLHQFLIIRMKDTSALKDHVWLGVIAAISFLSRTDNAVIVLILFVFLYIPSAIIKYEFKHGLAACTILIGLTSPWLIWNLDHFGSIVQISGQIHDNTWLVDVVPVDMTLPEQLINGVTKSLGFIKIVFEKMFAPDFAPHVSGYIYFFTFVLVISLAKIKNRAIEKNFRLFLPFFTGIVILFLYHAGVRHFVRGWYNASVFLMLALVICFLLDEIPIPSFTKPHKSIFIATLVVLLLCYSPYHYTKHDKNILLDDRVAIAEWINLNIPADAIIGAANAGIMGYYTNRTVVNLDGVVNEHAFRARIADRLQPYIAASHITYLADHKGSIAHLCRTNIYYTCSQVDNLKRSTQVMRINY